MCISPLLKIVPNKMQYKLGYYHLLHHHHLSAVHNRFRTLLFFNSTIYL